MKSTIGIVLSSLPGYSETFFTNKIKALQNSGFEVVLFIGYQREHEKELQCRIVVLDAFNVSPFLRIFKSFNALLKAAFVNPLRSIKLFNLNRNDGLSVKKSLKSVIINQSLLTENLDWLHFGYAMLAVGREAVAETIGAKMAVSFRGFDMYLSPLKHVNCYQCLFKKDVTYHVLSKKMKSLLETEGVLGSKISIITPAIHTDDFIPLANRENSTKINILTVARLHWVKGIEYTLEALALLKNQGINFTYTLIGSGEELERLKFAAYQLGVLDDVIFTGKIPHTSVKKAMEHSEIYLQYSIQEGFCNAVLEAQAMGLLCVVSDSGGLEENVLHNQTGWVVPSRTPELLAIKISEVIKLSLVEKKQISDHAILRVQKEFNIQKQQQEFIDLYAC